MEVERDDSPALTSPSLVEHRHSPAPLAPRRSPLAARPHEILAAGYFGLVALLVLLFGHPLAAWVPTLLRYAGGALILIAVFPRLPDRGWANVVRDWLPVLVLPVLYGDVARLNDLFTHGYHDAVIQRLELALFHTQPSVTLRQVLWWKPLSEYLHLGYFGYYTVLPSLGVTLYLRRRYDDYRLAVTSVLAVFFFCYLWFITYPVAGPWYNFPRPDAASVGWLFPRLVHHMLDVGASRGAAFPSSHVAVAVVVFLLAWRLERALFYFLCFIVPALIVGTVYGGFHYAIDAMAGLVVGTCGYLLGPRLHRALGGRVDEPAR